MIRDGSFIRRNSTWSPAFRLLLIATVGISPTYRSAVAQETKNAGFYHGTEWCKSQEDQMVAEEKAALQTYSEDKARYDVAAKAYQDALTQAKNWAKDNPGKTPNPHASEVNETLKAMKAAEATMKAAANAVYDIEAAMKSLGRECSGEGGASTGGGGSSGGGGGGGGGSPGGGSAGSGGGQGGGKTRPATTVDALIPIFRYTRPPKDTVRLPKITGLGFFLARDMAAQLRLDSALARASSPHPLRDSVGVGRSPQPLPIAIPTDASPVARSALDASTSIEQEIADLLAYAIDYGRYWGALEAHDTAAERAQAESMTDLMHDAIGAARNAAMKRSETDQRLLAMLDSLLQPTRGKIPTPPISDMTPELESELSGGGMSPAGIAAIKARMKATNSDSASAIATELRARIGVDSAIARNLDKAGSRAKWPEPAEIGTLEHAYTNARKSSEAISNGTAHDFKPKTFGLSRSRWLVVLVLILAALGAYFASARRRSA